MNWVQLNNSNIDCCSSCNVLYVGDYYMFYTGTADSLRWLMFEETARWIAMKIRACTVIDIYLSSIMDKQQDYFNIKLGLQNNTKSQIYCKYFV